VVLELIFGLVGNSLEGSVLQLQTTNFSYKVMLKVRRKHQRDLKILNLNSSSKCAANSLFLYFQNKSPRCFFL